MARAWRGGIPAPLSRRLSADRAGVATGIAAPTCAFRSRSRRSGWRGGRSTASVGAPLPRLTPFVPGVRREERIAPSGAGARLAARAQVSCAPFFPCPPRVSSPRRSAPYSRSRSVPWAFACCAHRRQPSCRCPGPRLRPPSCRPPFPDRSSCTWPARSLGRACTPSTRAARRRCRRGCGWHNT